MNTWKYWFELVSLKLLR